MDARVYRVVKACPLCANDVKGNPESLFYCKDCNVRFRLEHLVMDKHERALNAPK
jgi:tRNA(Ile2) C34 agmatinyltransferase TiaS